MKTQAHFDNAFEGKHVLVTGASSGIGLSVAQGFSRAGASLTILAENDAIHLAAETISEQGKFPSNVLQCDVSDPDTVSELVGSLPDIDVIAHIAGYQPTTPVLNPAPAVDEAFRRCMDINVNGTWYIVRSAVAKMQRGGKIILTSSIWGKTGVPEYAGYVASKHAVIGLTRALAAELGPKGINVNAVCPGLVETEGAMWTLRAQAKATGIPLADHVEELTSRLPIPGIMAPDAMNSTFLFLASDMANNITGQAYSVDRGDGLG